MAENTFGNGGSAAIISIMAAFSVNGGEISASVASLAYQTMASAY
jgi:hypothetical protein